MAMLRESPWYLEIENEGIQKGIQQGMQEGIEQGMQEGIQQGQAELVLRVLSRRFGDASSRLAPAVRSVSSERMPDLLDVALTAGSLDEVAVAMETLAVGASNGSQSER